jgi:hypothetical protein
MAEEPPAPHSQRDPRLEIPELLRTPAPKAAYDPVYGRRSPRQGSPQFVGAARAWATALDFVFMVLVGAGLGWLVDYWRHSLPVWTMVGLGVGFISAVVRIIRATRDQELTRKGGPEA